MQVSRKGVTRMVFIFSSFVVKVPKPRIWNHFLRGILANINEKKTWRWNSGQFENGLSHLLCPVIWCSAGGWILVMKRARLITDKEFEDHSLSEHLKFFPGDDTISNYGFLDGRLVKIDYGELDIVPSVFNQNKL